MAELIDLYDKNKKPLNRTIRRGKAIKKNEYGLVVLGIVINKNNQILLTKRSMEKSIAPGLWECTAGAVTSGESSKEAIKREVKEEIGLDLKNINIEYKSSFMETSFIFDVWLIKVDFDPKYLKIDKTEVEEVKVLNINELHSFIKDNDDITKSLHNVLEIINNTDLTIISN